ncbi:hypothetical protein BH24ACI3_BH24ACI3_03770 [soil metagenome]
MSHSPLALSRRHVLGDLYGRCDAVVSVPVYLNNEEGEMLGYADEGLGHYADAFLFHLPEDVCKRLATGHFNYSFGYEFADDTSSNGGDKRITLSSICLTGRPAATPAQPRTRKSKVEAVAEVAAVAD